MAISAIAGSAVGNRCLSKALVSRSLHTQVKSTAIDHPEVLSLTLIDRIYTIPTRRPILTTFRGVVSRWFVSFSFAYALRAH
jgi:hypothetical protein